MAEFAYPDESEDDEIDATVTEPEPSSRPRPSTVVYVGMSVDGFIARPDGAVDFLDPPEGAPPGDPEDDLGFAELLESVDAMVMGRATFAFVRDGGFDWPYGELPLIVMSAGSPEIPASLAATVEVSARSPAEVLDDLAQRGVRRVYVDGGSVVQSFLRDGLVDELVLTRVPILIGSGISIFPALGTDVRVEHVSTTSHHGGLVQSTYLVQRSLGW